MMKRETEVRRQKWGFRRNPQGDALFDENEDDFGYKSLDMKRLVKDLEPVLPRSAKIALDGDRKLLLSIAHKHGIYLIQIEIPEAFPRHRPAVKCLTQLAVYHPAIDEEGRVAVWWARGSTLTSLIFSLVKMFMSLPSDADSDSPLSEKDRDLFN